MKRGPSTTARSPAGFTLLEVLIALLIFTIAAVGLGTAYVNVLRGYEVAAQAVQVDEEAKFARAQLLAEPDVEKAKTGADFESTDGRKVVWSSTIEATELPDLFTVTFVCETSGPMLKEPVKTTQVFRVLRPTWSQAADRGVLRQAVQDRIAEIQGKDKS